MTDTAETPDFIVAELPPSRCPVCGHLLMFAMANRKNPPKPNDFTVCVFCASVLRWNQEMQLYLVPADEYDALTTQQKEELGRTVAVVYRYHEKEVPKKQRLKETKN